jgi:hypothetical protein
VNWKALAAGVGGLAGAGVALYWLKKQGYGGRVTLSAPSTITYCKDVAELRGRVTQFLIFPVKATFSIYLYYQGRRTALIEGALTADDGSFVVKWGPIPLATHADTEISDYVELEAEAVIAGKTYVSPRVPVTLYAPVCTGPC